MLVVRRGEKRREFLIRREEMEEGEGGDFVVVDFSAWFIIITFVRRWVRWLTRTALIDRSLHTTRRRRRRRRRSSK